MNSYERHVLTIGARIMGEKDNDLLRCDDCGKAKEDVRHTTCPYAEEINDSINPVTLCDDCYHERCMDI